jgi:hypothetical protein
LYGNTSGNDNVAVGFQSLYFNSTGGQNTAIGTYAYYNGNYSNSTAIGYNTAINASNLVRIGNSSVTSIGGFQNWSNVSDKRFKTNITEDVVGLEFVLNLRPVTYNLDTEKIDSFLGTESTSAVDRQKSQIRQSGFIAQEVEQTAKAVGFEFSGVDKPKNEEDYYGLRYAEFVVPLVKGMQEQQQIIEGLIQQVESLKKEVELLQNK